MGFTYFLLKVRKTNKSLKKQPSLNIAKTVLYALLGVIGLAVGCHIIVYCAVELSAIFCIPAMFAGIILAFGTTSPEFFTVITSARKGLDNLALGTVLGSNIFNIMIGLGVPAILATVPVDHLS